MASTALIKVTLTCP